MVNQFQVQQLVAGLSTTLTNDEVVAILNTPTYREVNYISFQAFMFQQPCWAKIAMLSVDPTADPSVRGLCMVARDLLVNYKATIVDFSLPQFQQILNALVSAGVVSTDEKTAILSLGEVFSCGGIVALEDIVKARQQLLLNQQRNEITMWWQNKSSIILAAIDQGYQMGTIPSQANLLKML